MALHILLVFVNAILVANFGGKALSSKFDRRNNAILCGICLVVLILNLIALLIY